MNAIKPAAIVIILALGIAGAATVAPAASAQRVVMNQTVDSNLPAITIVAKRMSAAEKARSAV